MSLISKYKERVNFKHGWEVELQCPQCRHDGLPECSGGRTPKPKEWNKDPGDTPMICANVTCAECGHDLKEQASEKLTELFKDVPNPAPKQEAAVWLHLCRCRLTADLRRDSLGWGRCWLVGLLVVCLAQRFLGHLSPGDILLQLQGSLDSICLRVWRSEVPLHGSAGSVLLLSLLFVWETA